MSLQAAVDTHNSDIVAITEIKSPPPSLEGYAPWIVKLRPDKAGGGVAITTKKELEQNTEKVDDLEDNNNQEILWIQVGTNKKKKVYIGVYYGKQESAPAEEIEREMSQIRSHLHKLTNKGHVVLTGDFNAKMKITNNGTTIQDVSRNGQMLEELTQDLNLTAISTKSQEGTWTRVPWNPKEKKSVIDYMIIKKEDENRIEENIVDEAGTLKIRGEKASDHNTLCLTMRINPKMEKKTTTKWRLNNEEGWREFNEKIQRMEDTEIDDYNQAEKIIKQTLENTIGKITITMNGNRRKKEDDATKELRENMKSNRKAFNEATRLKQQNRQELMGKYIQSQKKLREKIEDNHRYEMRKIAHQIKKEGGCKSQLFWKERRKITPKQGGSWYTTVDEAGEPIENPEKAKEHIADYFENLYQAREARPEYQQWTTEIKQAIKRIEGEYQTNLDILPITNDEIAKVVKNLKTGKAPGPDGIPNEMFKKSEEETLEVYRQIMQKIAEKRNIPKQWQEGHIIRLYKGKGKQGKCSNERGITLSSNFGKVFERILNERARAVTNMTENQAGGQKGKATVDHLLTLNETIQEIRKQGKPVYIVFLDVTKAYDKAWLDAIMYVMHKQGLKGPEWDLIKKMNENLSARISTRHGNTREIKIKDSIRQGGVLSVLQYALLIDEINKEIQKENLGTYVPSLDEIIGCLLWMDDVILITSDPKEMQKMLNITDETAGIYHIEFGEEKSKAMKIGGNKTLPDLRLGDMKLAYSDKYKYLGFMQNKKNNLEDHIKLITGKVEFTYQTILTIAGNKNFKDIEMETIWELIQSCITAIISYSSEVWKPNKKENEKINRLMDNILKRILMVPQTTPREALYIETGLLDPEAIRMKNRINMEHRLKMGPSQRMKNATKNNNNRTWAAENEKIKETLQIEKEDLQGDKYEVKIRTLKKITEWFKTKIENDSENKSKVQHLIEGKGEWKPLKRAKYMNKLTRVQASTIFKARTRMLPVKDNYKNRHPEHTCRACGAARETQQHVLEDCPTLHPNGEYKVVKDQLFSDNTNNLKKLSGNILMVLQQLNNLTQQGNPQQTTTHHETTPNNTPTTTQTQTTNNNRTARPTADSSHPATRECTR